MRLLIKVWHKDSGAFSSAEALGKIEIPISNLVIGRLFDEELFLQPTGTLSQAKGSLHVVINVVPGQASSSSDPKSQITVYMMRYYATKSINVQRTMLSLSPSLHDDILA